MVQQRDRSMMEELPVILKYPFVDKVSFVLLSLFVWFFTLAGSLALFGGGMAILLSQGLLYAYAFTALNRVSTGNMKSYMPDIGDISDLARPLMLGLASLLISWGPVVLLLYFHPDASLPWMNLMRKPEVEQSESFGAAHAQEDAPEPDEAVQEDEQVSDNEEEDSDDDDQDDRTEDLDEDEYADEDWEDEFDVPLHIKALLALALLWKLIYTPMSLVVAGITRSFLQTINPVAGITCIGRMGSVYWQALGIYVVITIAQTLIGLPLNMIPIAGGLVMGFINVYGFLVTGCTLGLAVAKKASDLGLE